MVNGLSPGCHQMDFIDDHLYVTDTYSNRLLTFEEHCDQLVPSIEAFPPGKLDNGRASPNYAHMNSVWRSPCGHLYVFYHNETSKTGRKGSIVRLSQGLQEAEVYPADANNGHNILVHDGHFVFCDSMNGRLMLGGRCVFKASLFTRGLAKTPRLWLVGGSQYGDRGMRNELGGAIYVLSSDFCLRGMVEIPGMVQEIRATNSDYGLSATAV